MLLKPLTVAALASAVAAQSNSSLTAVLQSNPNLSNLTSYLGLFPDLVSQLSSAQNVTLLAPDNNAFAALLNSSVGAAFSANNTALIQALFSYHLLMGTHYASDITETPQFIQTGLTRQTNLTLLENGAVVEALKSGNETLFVSGVLTRSRVIEANQNFTGGTIHVIDTFLTIPQNISATLVPLNQTAAVGALKKANIAAGPLPNNLTAFIPNNAAWQAVNSVVQNLSIADLTGILAYHLVPNVVGYSTDLMNMTLPTLANSTLTITVSNGTVYVNDAKVITPNILVEEGVVHIIDAVLNPANTTGMPEATRTAVNFASASSGSEIPFTSGIPTPTTVPVGATGGGAAEATSSSSSGLAAAVRPIQTGAIGAAVLFGAAAVGLNL